LAVTGVVVYHVWPWALPGGFVGVDVFFVISGFLITRHLADEVARTGTVRLGRFWARRIRRILPAAFAVLVACVALTLLVLPAMAWPENLEEIRASALYVENWLLAGHAVDYLAAENAPSLVQHYWSLSLEEQFYLVWPLLLLLALPLTAVLRLHRPRFALVCMLTATGLASFVACVLWTRADQPVAFFATATRAWEFAAGGLVGVLASRLRSPAPSPLRSVTAWAGWALVLASYGRLSAASPFPGTAALLPVCGAVLVIAAGPAGTRRSPDRVVARWPLQWLGDHSYSVYLWHWPLVVVLPFLAGRTAATGWEVVLLTLPLAALTKLWVEDPVRTGRRWTRTPAPAYALAIVGAVTLSVATAHLTTDVNREQTVVAAADRARVHALALRLLPSSPSPSASAARSAQVLPRSCFGAAAMDPYDRCAHPFSRPPGLDLTFAADDGRNDPCLEKADVATPLYCAFGPTHPRATVAVVGNSHAWRLLPAIKLYGQRHGWRIITALRVNCTGLLTVRVASAAPTDACLQWSAAVQQRLLSMPGLTAVVFPSYAFEQTFLVGSTASPAQVGAAAQQVLATWRAFDARHVRVLVIQDVPGMRPTDDPQCLAQSSQAVDPCSVPRAQVVHPNLASSLAVAHPGVVSYIPLDQYFCDPQRCHALIGGVVVYFDSHHLTTTYSESLARYLGPALANAIART
jgi:peptidoglycan/LPS O-acetylase OafA/YrhL